jgi:hypothetical protein
MGMTTDDVAGLMTGHGGCADLMMSRASAHSKPCKRPRTKPQCAVSRYEQPIICATRRNFLSRVQILAPSVSATDASR